MATPLTFGNLKNNMVNLQKNISALRFNMAMLLHSEIVTQKPQVVGLHNLEKIPKGINPIIAGTHLRSDASLQIIARELGKKFNLGIALQSENRKNPLINVFFSLVGQDNFYDIDNKTIRRMVNGKSERTDTYKLNLNNYEAMKDAMKIGKTLLIAGHWAPVYNGILPDKPGFATAYLAHLSNQRVVLPVVLDIYTDDEDLGRIDRISKIIKNLLTDNRPKSKMTICKPIILDPINSLDIDLMRRLMQAKIEQKSSGLNSKEGKIAVETNKKIRRDSERVMYAFAKVLPPEKRGIWGKKVK